MQKVFDQADGCIPAAHSTQDAAQIKLKMMLKIIKRVLLEKLLMHKIR